MNEELVKSDSENGMMLSWKNLSVFVVDKANKKCKCLINNVSGIAMPGDLTAILGQSGAGKSSFMMTLAHRNDYGLISEGNIQVNGKPVNAAYMREKCGYLYQDDMFYGSMTVGEHMWFMARMKLDRSSNALNIQSKIDTLLQELNLYVKKDVRIGDSGMKLLSGGEKKRLSFAAELITDPKLLFLDEPTTNQDSLSAHVLINYLSSFIKQQRTVLCTIHQPSSSIYANFNKIIFIANGRIAFSGTKEEALTFFTSLGYECPIDYNPADYFVSVLAIPPRSDGSQEEIVQRICDAFQMSATYKKMEEYIVNQIPRKSSDYWLRETFNLKRKIFDPRCALKFIWLAHREFVQVVRKPSIQLFKALQNICIAVMTGLCFAGSIHLDQFGIQAVQGVIFIMVAENTFSPMYATLALFPKDFPLFMREYQAGMYSIYSYYLSRVISLVPGLILQPIIFTSLVYLLAGLRLELEAYLYTLLVVVLTINVSAACGCFFSASFESVDFAMAYLVPFDYVLMMTMGSFAKVGSLPLYVRWIKYISWLHQATEALSVIQWKNVSNITCNPSNTELPCLSTGTEVLTHHDFFEEHFEMDLELMVAMYFVFHFLGFIFLWRKCNLKKRKDKLL